MAHSRDSSPVYYREIQKNAYLKRLPEDVSSSKPLGLRPLGLNKKPPPKPLWTQLCVHNGRTPYLEQYRDPVSARAHRPVWRASLLTARHVTASVTPRDNQHDFLIDTDHGPVRMLAPDWETMQDWVATLRSKLHELKIVPPCENVYCAPPAAAPPRAAARDPTSPLPPTPPLPPDRVPGIDLTPIIRTNVVQTTSAQPETTTEESQPPSATTTQSNTTSNISNIPTYVQNTSTSTLSISNLQSNVSNAAQKIPSASNYSPIAPNVTTTAQTMSVTATNISVTKPNKSMTTPHMSNSPSRTVTGPNYSVLTPNSSVTTANTSVTGLNMSMTGPNMSMTGPNLSVPSEAVDISSWETPETEEPFTSLPSTSQVPKSVAKICGQNICLDDSIFKRTCHSDDDDFLSEDRSSLGSKSGSVGSKSDIRSKTVKVGSRTDNLDSQSDSNIDSDINNYKQTLVVSDKQGDTMENGTSNRSTNITVIQVSNKEPPHTAIPVIGPETDVFDFNFKSAPRNPNFINIVNTEVNVQNSNEYGTVFTKNEPEYGHISLTTTVSLTGDVKLTDVNARSDNEGLYEKLCLASTSKGSKASPMPIRKLKSQEKIRKSSLPNLDAINSDPLYEYLFLSQNSNGISNVTLSNNVATGNVASNPNNVATTLVNNLTTTNRNITTAANNITTISTTNVISNSENNDSRVQLNSVPILDSNTRAVRSVIERSNSQNAYDVSPRREARLDQSIGQKRNGKAEKIESVQPKPIWKRGLTELSLLTRLRGITQSKRHESPDRQNDRNVAASPVKVVHRSRPDTRVDRSRRRSSSLSNGQPPPAASSPPSLQPLRARQAAALRSEQRRGAALVATCSAAHPPVFVDYNKQVWVAWWGGQGVRFSGRAGDRACGVRGLMPRDAAHARELIANAHAPTVDILFHRVPLGKIYVVTKRDQENTGIKIDSECNITSVEGDSPAAAAGIPPPGKWAVTEVNNRPLNLIKVDTDDINRLTLRGTEASVLIQPSALVKKLRAAIKGNKNLLGLR